MCGKLFLRFIFLATADAGGIVHAGEVKVYVCLQGKLQYLNEWRISLPTMSADHRRKLAKSSYMIRQTKSLDSRVYV